MPTRLNDKELTTANINIRLPYNITIHERQPLNYIIRVKEHIAISYSGIDIAYNVASPISLSHNNYALSVREKEIKFYD